MLEHIGRIKTNAVDFTIRHPRLNRAVDVLGSIAHTVSFGAYTPALTRTSQLLFQFQHEFPYDSAVLKNDGFYNHKGEFIGGNPVISSTLKAHGLFTDGFNLEIDSYRSFSQFYRATVSSKFYSHFKTIAKVSFALAVPDWIIRFAANRLFIQNKYWFSSSGAFTSNDWGTRSVLDPNLPESLKNILGNQSLFSNVQHWLPISPKLVLPMLGVVSYLICIASKFSYDRKLGNEKIGSFISAAVAACIMAAGMTSGLEMISSPSVTDYMSIRGIGGWHIWANLADLYLTFGGATLLLYAVPKVLTPTKR